MTSSSASEYRKEAASAVKSLFLLSLLFCFSVYIIYDPIRKPTPCKKPAFRSPVFQLQANFELLDTAGPLTRLNDKLSAEEQQASANNDDDYFVFLQKFPLENTFQMIFHTEVVVCPRSTFEDDDKFLSLLDHLTDTLTRNDHPFIYIPDDKWTEQSKPSCVQLGYGGGSCPTSCCGSPHEQENTNYALSSRTAVIGNAMGDFKSVFIYGRSNSINGMKAYRAVCGGGTDEQPNKMPTCVSNWAGTDYNPLTNNCNTFTSTILKCVYGLSDKKPGLGVSDMVTVTCPMETRDDGMDVQQCLIPEETKMLSSSDEFDVKKEE